MPTKPSNIIPKLGQAQTGVLAVHMQRPGQKCVAGQMFRKAWHDSRRALTSPLLSNNAGG